MRPRSCRAWSCPPGPEAAHERPAPTRPPRDHGSGASSSPRDPRAPELYGRLQAASRTTGVPSCVSPFWQIRDDRLEGPLFSRPSKRRSHWERRPSYVSASEMTSQKSVKTPASRRRTGPSAVWIFSGRPLKEVKKVIVPASSSTRGAGPLTSPADEMTTDLPFAGFVTLELKELVSLKLSSA